MLICCHVAAEFRDKDYNLVFKVAQKDINQFLDAPDAIVNTPEFKAYMKDGSLRANFTSQEQKYLENDPTAGVTAEGKSAAVLMPEDVEAEAPAKPTKKTGKKPEAADAQ